MTSSHLACSCPDYRYRGGNLSRQRLTARAKDAQVIGTERQAPGEFWTWTAHDREKGHWVVLDEGAELDRLCKHCLAVLRDLGVRLWSVEYDDPQWGIPTWEVRREAFWGDGRAVALIMADGEVRSVEEIEIGRGDEHE
jgi:hypothetical protein